MYHNRQLMSWSRSNDFCDQPWTYNKQPAMNLELKRFRKEYYTEYASWFSDPELDRHLGPMDLAWLEATLSQPESQGVTWAVFCGRELIAVVETAFGEENCMPAAITALATKPSLRQRGIGTRVLQMIRKLHGSKAISAHIAYVSVDNEAGRRCVTNVPILSLPTRRLAIP
jgi:ribosomal protein S18 acetylase RimI-like enzyme